MSCPENSDAIGHLVWALPPRRVFSFEFGIMEGCQINTMEIGGFRSEHLEFLARDEDDFCNEAPIIPWEQFLSQCRATKEKDLA